MTETFRRPRRALRCTSLLVVLGLALPAGASAALRSPHLESTCPAGYRYGEETVAAFLVEGCHKDLPLRDGQQKRIGFSGKLEVNGLLVEPASGSDDLVATQEMGPRVNFQETLVGNLDRSASTKLILDPRIGGSRRKMTFNQGPVHLESSSYYERFPGGGFQPMVGDYTIDSSVFNAYDGRGLGVVAPGATVADPDPRATRLQQDRVVGTTTLPVGGTPALLGLRLFDVDDVELEDDGMSMSAELRLGSLASDLLGDVSGAATIELVDGEGMRLTDLKFKIGHIGIPNVGGIDRFRITYDASRDEWGGGFELELGDLFPSLDFAATVSASTGAPTSMRLALEPLNIPLGPTGITLQEVRAGFGLDPLILTGGVGVTAGPQVGGNALIRGDGDVTVQIEPNFRFETEATVRLLTTGQNSQLARGSARFVYDSTGFISLRGDARFDATAAGFGISADIRGNGSYSTTANVFNIGAGATGNLELGPLGPFEVASLDAVVSSDGWAACGRLLSILSAGLGQQWRGNMRLMTGCDMAPYRVNVARASRAEITAERLQNVDTTAFQIGGTHAKAAIQITADRPGARVRLFNPQGGVVATLDGSTIKTEELVAFTEPDSGGTVYTVFVKDPPPGRWAARTLATDPRITRIRTALPAEPLRAEVEVARAPGGRPGARRLRARVRAGLGEGDQIQYGVKAPDGSFAPIAAPGPGDATLPFLQDGFGRNEVVAQVFRDGIPIPGRSTVVGSWTSNPESAEGIRTQRQGRKLRILARPRQGAELPNAWEYRIRAGGKEAAIRKAPGKTLKLWLPRKAGRVRIEVHPVFRGKAIERVAKVVTVK